ncbi:hypothetical protein Tco_1463734, partial [Tanacetum coccineum]
TLRKCKDHPCGETFGASIVPVPVRKLLGKPLVQVSSLGVHQSSTDAASSLLVTALNEGRDVIMDGTLSWVPFVLQTITMARNVHRKRYRMGPGYKRNDDGSVTENYWEQLDEESEPLDGHTKRRPYLSSCYKRHKHFLKVIHSDMRAIMCRRAVRVRSQLKSHMRFAMAFMTYCNLVDGARPYLTNDLDGPPKKVTGHKRLAKWKQISPLNDMPIGVHKFRNLIDFSIMFVTAVAILQSKTVRLLAIRDCFRLVLFGYQDSKEEVYE